MRKKSQLRASFIKNQITNHINYKPFAVYLLDRQKSVDGGFAEYDYENLEELNLVVNFNKWSKLFYKYLKRISRIQAKEIRKYINDKEIKILHFHYGTDAGIYLPLLKNINLPKVVSFYGYECSGFPRRFLGFGKFYLKSRTFKYADKIFAMSEDMKKDLLSLGCPNDKIILHYYGTDTSKFLNKHNYESHNPVSFLIISGLTPQKGHEFLLKAFFKAHEKNKNIKLTIVGEGPSKNLINSTITNLGMHEYVSLKPFVVYASDEHNKYLSNADVFIHPSLTDTNGDKEGIPGAIIEAMAAGLPIISTNHAGIPYIINNGETGLLVDEWDISGLTKSILLLATNSNLRKQIGEAGQLHVLNNLDLKDKEKELEQIYKDLIVR